MVVAKCQAYVTTDVSPSKTKPTATAMVVQKTCRSDQLYTDFQHIALYILSEYVKLCESTQNGMYAGKPTNHFFQTVPPKRRSHTHTRQPVCVSTYVEIHHQHNISPPPPATTTNTGAKCKTPMKQSIEQRLCNIMFTEHNMKSAKKNFNSY